MAVKINKLSRVKPKHIEEMDTVQWAKQSCCDNRRATDVLLHAQTLYQNMQRFREDRERNKKYTYGDQWSDKVCVDGQTMTEEQYIMKQGNVPLKNNLIRRLVRNVIGVYRNQATEPTCIARDRDEQTMAETMSTLLQYNMQLNRMSEVYSRSLEEFLISGMVVHRKWFGRNGDSEDCWTEYVQANNFFIDTDMRDFRSWDCSCVGEVHDISFESLCAEFAHSPEDYKKLSDIYHMAKQSRVFTQMWDEFGFSDRPQFDFLIPSNDTRCRVIEVWRKETKPRYWCHDYNNGDVFKVDEADFDELVTQENNRRIQQGLEVGIPEEEIPLIEYTWFIDSYWYYYFLTPFGDILDEGETPYSHKSHPYVFKAYPFIDGEIHSFVADIIDQQRYTNRLITMYDMIMRSSAKGVLMVPADSVPKGMSIEQFADTWTRHNGAIVYTPSKSGDVPRQVQANSTNIGISELLSMQVKFFEDISGIHGALQGKTGYSGTSASLYSMQTQNATTSLMDILDSFAEFVKDCAYKDAKNIQQYYDDNKIANIAGGSISLYDDVSRVRNIEFDMSIVPSNSTPVYRAITNEFLMQLWQSQAISLEQLLEHGNFPFADSLLQSIKAQNEKVQQGQIPDDASPQLLQQIQQAQIAQQQ